MFGYKMLNQYISTLKLSNEIKTELNKAGYVYVKDLNEDNKILKRYNINLQELTQHRKVNSALDILCNETRLGFIPTLSHQLDELIGGGIQIKKCTELCGMPGSGKTQMCLQICANVRIPKGAGGIGGQAIFIDTRNGFTTKRLRQIASSCVELVNKFVSTFNPKEKEEIDLSYFTADYIMKGIFYKKVNTYIEILAVIKTLYNFLKKNPYVKLIVIDSISFPFMTQVDKLARIQILYTLFTKLQILSDIFGLAIIVTNEMTHRFGLEELKSDDYLVPCLGDSYAHRVNFRILLSKKSPRGIFSAKVIKNIMGPNKTVDFLINEHGIRPITHL